MLLAVVIISLTWTKAQTLPSNLFKQLSSSNYITNQVKTYDLYDMLSSFRFMWLFWIVWVFGKVTLFYVTSYKALLGDQQSMTA